MKTSRFSLVVIMGICFLFLFCHQGPPVYGDAGVTSAPSVLLDVPFVSQKPDYCGEAVYAMAFQYYGRNLTQDDIHQAACPTQTRGCYSYELHNGAISLNMPLVQRWIPVGSQRSWPADELDAVFAQAKAELQQGKPVMFGSYLRETIDPSYLGHFMLLVGYDDATHTVYYHDPAGGPYETMSYSQFYYYWPMPTVTYSSWALLTHTFGNGNSAFVSVTPSNLVFLAERGTVSTRPLTLAVNTSPGESPAWTATVEPYVPWIAISPASGNGPATLSVRTDIGELAVGNYETRLVIRSTANRAYVDVQLIVTDHFFAEYLPLIIR